MDSRKWVLKKEEAGEWVKRDNGIMTNQIKSYRWEIRKKPKGTDRHFIGLKKEDRDMKKACEAKT